MGNQWGVGEASGALGSCASQFSGPPLPTLLVLRRCVDIRSRTLRFVFPIVLLSVCDLVCFFFFFFLVTVVQHGP